MVSRGTMGVNSLPKTVTRQHHGCYLTRGPTVPESSMLTTRLPSHPTQKLELNCGCLPALQTIALPLGRCITVAFPHWGRGAQAPPNLVLGPRFNRPPKLWLVPPYLAVLLTQCGQLLLSKIGKFDVTRCQILRLKCAKFDFRGVFALDPAGGAYSIPPEPLAVFKVVYF